MKILAFSDARSTIELPDAAADLVVLLGHIPSKLVKRIDEQYDCMKVGLLSDKCHPTVYEDTSIVDIHKRVFTYEGLRLQVTVVFLYIEKRSQSGNTQNQRQSFC